MDDTRPTRADLLETIEKLSQEVTDRGERIEGLVDSLEESFTRQEEYVRCIDELNKQVISLENVVSDLHDMNC